MIQTMTTNMRIYPGRYLSISRASCIIVGHNTALNIDGLMDCWRDHVIEMPRKRTRMVSEANDDKPQSLTSFLAL